MPACGLAWPYMCGRSADPAETNIDPAETNISCLLSPKLREKRNLHDCKSHTKYNSGNFSVVVKISKCLVVYSRIS